jgi:hypothetical protein
MVWTKRDEVTGVLRKLLDKGAHNLKFMRMSWTGHVTRMGRRIILMGKPEGKRSLGRLRRW